MDCVASKQELVWVLWHRGLGLYPEQLGSWPIIPPPHFLSTSLHAALCAKNSGGHKGDAVPMFRNYSQEFEMGCARSQWTASLGTTQCSYLHSQQLEWDQ